MADPTPTLAQLEVLRLIDAGRKAHGYAPTIRELCDQLKVTSTYTVAGHLRALRAKGLVSWAKTKGRTLAITDAGRPWLLVTPQQLEKHRRQLAAEARLARGAA